MLLNSGTNIKNLFSPNGVIPMFANTLYLSVVSVGLLIKWANL
ncbi:hypothetical protein [Mycoplasmopsis canis]|nr:hypothetical protein [Mycoplasmopsis canis]